MKMALNIYWTGLIILMPLVAFVAGHKIILRPFRSLKSEKTSPTCAHDDEARKFRRKFLRVYLLVMGSEWLQGPYMYSLFRDEKGLSERTVAILYVTTYISAAASAVFTGYLADKFGRRAACLVFCIIHSLASISVLFNVVEVLIIGRVLGGIGLNLLWTVFESWMVTEYNARKLDQSSFPLSSMFGIMTTSNCTTAILAGVLSHCIVLALGSKSDPFIVGVILDFSAAVLMLHTWNENRGTVDTESLESRCEDGDEQNYQPQQGEPTAMLKDVRIWVLSFASCCFQGTIFLLMFFWPETLQHAHDKEHPAEKTAVPYGVTFATFMAAMVLGAMMFNIVTRNPGSGDEALVRIVGITMPTLLLTIALLLSALGFFIAALAKAEIHQFMAFLLLECCNGIYVPSMAYHRGTIVNDSGRARVYGLMNIPLFIFVVAALCTTNNNEANHRQAVFVFCAMLLLVAALATVIGLRSSVTGKDVLKLPTSDIEEVDEDVKDSMPRRY
ncbi:MFS general substrate transporter [Xylariaceae sp. FL0662B]|nr:MFS general substrate transporter [Xylariaceae sp. FL0662B]